MSACLLLIFMLPTCSNNNNDCVYWKKPMNYWASKEHSSVAYEACPGVCNPLCRPITGPPTTAPSLHQWKIDAKTILHFWWKAKRMGTASGSLWDPDSDANWKTWVVQRRKMLVRVLAISAVHARIFEENFGLNWRVQNAKTLTTKPIAWRQLAQTAKLLQISALENVTIATLERFFIHEL